MSAINNTNNVQNTPVNHSGSVRDASKSALASEVIAAGALANDKLEISEEEGRSDVLTGQEQRSPELEVPDQVNLTGYSAASADISDIDVITQSAGSNFLNLLTNASVGILTSDQSVRLEEHAETVTGADQYIDLLHGQGADTPKGKQAILAGLGLSQSQTESAAHLASGQDQTENLVVKYGSEANLSAAKSALKNHGYNDQQLHALLSLGSPQNGQQAVTALGQQGATANDALKALGFSDSQSQRLAQLLNSPAPQSNPELRNLYSSLGFQKGGLDVLFAAAEPGDLQQQNTILTSTTPGQLNGQAQSINDLSANPKAAPDKIVEQLFDIFMVMELLHELGVTQRKSAREQRAVHYEAAKQDTLAQADEMKKAAASRLTAGLISGVAKIGAGAVSGAASIKAMNVKGPNGPDAAANAQAKAAQSQAILAKGNATSQILTGAGEAASAGFNYQAGLHDAEVKIKEAEQKTNENAAQAASELLQTHQDQIKSMQSKFEEIMRGYYETLKTTTRG